MVLRPGPATGVKAVGSKMYETLAFIAGITVFFSAAGVFYQRPKPGPQFFLPDFGQGELEMAHPLLPGCRLCPPPPKVRIKLSQKCKRAGPISKAEWMMGLAMW